MRKLKMDELERLSLRDFRALQKLPIVLVLDNIRSALNVGSAFRTADAFALEKIHLCGISAAPPHREIMKTALGSTETVEWEYSENPQTVVAALKSQGYKVLAVEQTDDSVSLQDLVFDVDEKFALIFGNEVEGVGEAVLAASDGSLEIPQFGTKHSLNVAVCVGIVCWEIVKKLKFEPKPVTK